MQTSIFLARLIGTFLLITGISVLVNRNNFRAMAEDVLGSRSLLFIAALITLPAGLAITMAHNLWVADWRIIITLLGWFTAIGAAVRLICPQFVIQTGRKFLQQPMMPVIAGSIWAVLGLILCFFGYR